jgi:hypothetical protein
VATFPETRPLTKGWSRDSKSDTLFDPIHLALQAGELGGILCVAQPARVGLWGQYHGAGGKLKILATGSVHSLPPPSSGIRTVTPRRLTSPIGIPVSSSWPPRSHPAPASLPMPGRPPPWRWRGYRRSSGRRPLDGPWPCSRRAPCGPTGRGPGHAFPLVQQSPSVQRERDRLILIFRLGIHDTALGGAQHRSEFLRPRSLHDLCAVARCTFGESQEEDVKTSK